MKKLMSVFVLLMFVGSLIIMTGCFGGDDGIGAILGVAIFVLAISASGGTGVAAFAANTKDNLRPAISNISYEAAKPTMKVYPLDDLGNKVGSGYDIATDKIDGKTNPGSFTAELQIQDNYTQYLVEVYAHGQMITQSIQSVPNTMKTGASTKISNKVDMTTSAQVRVFNKWNISSTRRKFSDFKENLDKVPTATLAVSAVATDVENAIKIWANTDQSTPPIFTTADTNAGSIVVSTTPYYNISGYVTQVDGAGSSNAYVIVSSTNPQFSTSAHCVNGYFTVTGVPAGTYTVSASIPDHTFEPCCYENVVVTDADITGKNFQAKARTAVQAPIGG
jgi:hypothetical protein